MLHISIRVLAAIALLLCHGGYLEAASTLNSQTISVEDTAWHSTIGYLEFFDKGECRATTSFEDGSPYWENGTYTLKGISIQVGLDSLTIQATVSNNKIEGTLTWKKDKKTERFEANRDEDYEPPAL